MSEFERLLDEYERAICEDGGVPEARAALLAYHERVVRERDNWQETAARHWSNELFYSGLLRDVGSLFPDCYVSDDGSAQDQPLALKVKECVQAALAERDARIAELEPDAERGRWLIDQAEDYDGHACFPEVRYRNGLQDGFEAKTVRDAIDRARKGGER